LSGDSGAEKNDGNDEDKQKESLKRIKIENERGLKQIYQRE
jgi:hypothetical protein